jgi:hypothetical protein
LDGFRDLVGGDVFHVLQVIDGARDFVWLANPTSRIQLAEHAFLFFFVNDFQGR